MFEEQIQAGMAFLDKKLLDWEHTIELDTLALQHCCRCVLGQVFGEYERGVFALNLSLEEARFYGFVIDGDSPERWTTLTNEWKAALEARLTPAL